MLIVVPEDVNKQGLGMLDGLAGFGMEIGGGGAGQMGKGDAGTADGDKQRIWTGRGSIVML